MLSTQHVCSRGIPRGLVAAALVALFADAAAGQAIVDARVAEFAPSADHTTIAGGVALVTSYELLIYGAGTTQVLYRVDLGKPSPGTGGQARVDFVARMPAPPAPGVAYQARVAALGPGGSAASALSNTFSFSECAPALSSSGVSAGAGASTGTVQVTAGSGCAWTSSSQASWLTIASGGSGTGGGTVSFAVAANAATASRSGTLTIAGRTFTVTQAAAACTYAITPSSVSAPAGGAGASISVATTAGCAWSASGLPGWIAAAGGTRTGPGTYTFTIAASTQAARAATFTVAGRTVTVTQASGLAPLAPRNLRIVSTPN